MVSLKLANPNTKNKMEYITKVRVLDFCKLLIYLVGRLEQSVPTKNKRRIQMKIKIVDRLPRRGRFAQPNFETQYTHKEDVEMEMSCSVCEKVFEENSEHYYVWLGQPDMNNSQVQTPFSFSCDSSNCMEENNRRASHELYLWKELG